MSVFEEYYVMITFLLTEPSCDIHVPLDLPVPHWVLAMMVVYDLMRGSIRNLKDFLWIITQLIIVSRMELLVMAMIIPYVIGKTSWCKSTEYLWGLATMFLRIAYIVISFVMQLNYVTPECLRKLEAVMIRNNYDEMNFNNPTSEYYWKIRMFGPFNICVMLVHKLFECIELPFNWIYVLLQDAAMWVEFRQQCRGVDWQQLTFDTAWDLVMNAGWSTSLFMFSFFGIHAVLIRQFVLTKPEYCKELMERLGF